MSHKDGPACPKCGKRALRYAVNVRQYFKLEDYPNEDGSTDLDDLIDTSYDSVGETNEKIYCDPSAGGCGAEWVDFEELSKTAAIDCKFCHCSFPEVRAHRHDGGWVCEDCWDERLRNTA